ncbi:MAG: hypothetical protein EOO88_34825 [Pedobacter sp.]|nr:MAG: hypothetical protein EOO88_34825 [Pedobacter sp.]
MPGHTGDILVPVSLPLIPNIELSKYDINTLRANYGRTETGRKVLVVIEPSAETTTINITP